MKYDIRVQKVKDSILYSVLVEALLMVKKSALKTTKQNKTNFLPTSNRLKAIQILLYWFNKKRKPMESRADEKMNLETSPLKFQWLPSSSSSSSLGYYIFSFFFSFFISLLFSPCWWKRWLYPRQKGKIPITPNETMQLYASCLYQIGIFDINRVQKIFQETTQKSKYKGTMIAIPWLLSIK